MSIDHVEMAFVDRDVHRFANRSARMMHRWRQIGQFHEVLEILDRRIAPFAVEIAHEGRPVDRRENGRLAADLHRALRIARVLGNDRRCGFQQ